jgi:hypothetical protein
LQGPQPSKSSLCLGQPGSIGRRAVVVALLGSVLQFTAAVPPAASDTVISSDPTAEYVSAYGGVVVWSRQTSSGRFRLVLRRNGLNRDAPVREFRHHVHADLGRGPRGRILATYHRCRGTRRCDLFVLNVRSGRERKLRTISTPRRAEFLPAVWGRRYVFARAPHFDGIRGIDGDARSGVFRSTPVRRLSRRLPLETDMRGTLFAFLYEPDLRTTVLTKWLDHRGRGPECVVVEADEGRSP